MDKRVNDKITTSMRSIKDSITSWFEENSCNVISIHDGQDKTSDLLKYIYDMQLPHISIDDLQKKTRTRAIIPDDIRCTARRASGEQCSRRRKGNYTTCGTHAKSNDVSGPVPHKIVKYKTCVYKGIHYYIDDNHNVYQTEDIMNSVEHPRIIATWNIDDNQKVVIPI